MKLPRSSGILLHPTSLPGRFGIGDLGSEAYRFVNFLADSHQRVWQVLPLGPTGYGDSPYQCFSAFAGNPLLISLEKLVDQGFLRPGDLEATPDFPKHEVEFGAVIEFKVPLLKRSYENFKSHAPATQRDQFQAFCHANALWLDDFALFMAVKEVHGGVAWTAWNHSIAARQPAAMKQWRDRLSHEIEVRKFWQYQFFKQWAELSRYCQERRIRLMGDIPIFVAHDSADVWSHGELFYLDADGRPTAVAGVPPDYFSATGQLWGNPLYRWEVIAQTGYQWWIERFRATLSLVDIVRLDHFRGFEAYWEVPGTETTAVRGRWVKGPGASLFEAVREKLGELAIVAENLGLITPEVEALRHRFGLPGMAVLQFAFGEDLQASEFLPHNYVRNLAVYTGTHDNDTTVGWWTSGVGDSTRTLDNVQREREFALKYLASDGREIHWAFIRAVLASVAALAVIPLQDVLGLGSEARMNLPARPGGNWRWRYHTDALTDDVRNRLRELTITYGRSSATEHENPFS